MYRAEELPGIEASRNVAVSEQGYHGPDAYAVAASTEVTAKAAEEASLTLEISLGNFFGNIPPYGHFVISLKQCREFGEEESDSMKRRGALIKTIEELLKTEFKDLDVEAIFEHVNAAKRLDESLLTDRSLDNEERIRFMRLRKRRWEFVHRALKPLFDRLLELGFDKNLLLY